MVGVIAGGYNLAGRRKGREEKESQERSWRKSEREKAFTFGGSRRK